MDYSSAFAISASGMAVEKTRLDITALNLANAHSTRAGGVLYQPLTVVSGPRAAQAGASFAQTLAAVPAGVEVVAVRPSGAAPRLVHEPGHPDADARGFVAYPGINPVDEMMRILTATRAYEANLAALNAARSMAQRALEIGGTS